MEYPFNEGELVSSDGDRLPVTAYEDLLVEEHAAHSTALHSRMDGGRLAHVGPLARYAINRDLLTPRARAAADGAGLGAVCRNPFKSILVRGVEVVFAFEEALRIIAGYRQPDRAWVPTKPTAGEGHGCTEAPRGICYHRYRLDDAGIIQDAKIVAPTSVNQKVIEQDLHDVVVPNIDLPDDALQRRCEQTIRNYDPCISCSTHFLKLNVDRR
jgi:coenzyme F420-reducing hydrogenase alpha subunit